MFRKDKEFVEVNVVRSEKVEDIEERRTAKRLDLLQAKPKLLGSIAASISREPGFEPMITSILTQVGRNLDCRSARLYLLNHNGSRLYLTGYYGPEKAREQVADEIELTAPSITALAARTAQVQIEPDVVGAPWHKAAVEVARTADDLSELKSKSMVAVPLSVQGRLLGVLSYTPSRQLVAREDVAFFYFLADVVSIGLNGAILLEKEQQTRQIFESVNRAILVTSRDFNLSAALQTIVDEARNVAHAKYGALGVLEKGAEGEKFRPWVFSGITPEQASRIGETPHAVGLLGAVPLEGKTIRCEDLSRDSRFKGFPANHPAMRSFLGVPIVYAGKSMGNLYLAEKTDADSFSADDERAVQLFADYAGIAVEHAHVHDELKREIAERRAAEAELELAKAKTVELAKLTALGEMAAGVAHEINNPLSAIRYHAQILDRLVAGGKLNGESVRSAAEGVDKLVSRISRIIEALRAFAREGGQEPFVSDSLRQILADTLELCSARFRNHNIALACDAVPEDLQIECRAVQISQVLLNLLNNAFDAAEQTSKPWVHLHVHDLGDTVVIEVVDSGTGIPENIRTRIMEPFYTTKSLGKGTGLGLSISKGIVDSHHGLLETGVLDGHTVFRVSLPKTQSRG